MRGRKLGSLCGSASTSIRVDRTAKQPEPIFVVRSPATCRDIDWSMCLCRITVRDMESSVAETCRTAQRVGPCHVRVQEPLAHRDRRSNSMHHPCLPAKVTRGRVSTYSLHVLRTAWCTPIALIRNSGTLRSRISHFLTLPPLHTPFWLRQCWPSRVRHRVRVPCEKAAELSKPSEASSSGALLQLRIIVLSGKS